MKKISSVIISMILCVLLSVTAMAYKMITVEPNEVLHAESCTCNDLLINFESSKLVIDDGVEIVLDESNVDIEGELEINGSLTGSVRSFHFSGDISVGPSANIDILFMKDRSENHAYELYDYFCNLGLNPEYSETREGIRFTLSQSIKPSGKEHEHNFVCTICGEKLSDVNNDYTASAFSDGNSSLCFGFGGLVIGFIAAAFIFRKKNTKADEK